MHTHRGHTRTHRHTHTGHTNAHTHAHTACTHTHLRWQNIMSVKSSGMPHTYSAVPAMARGHSCRCTPFQHSTVGSITSTRRPSPASAQL